MKSIKFFTLALIGLMLTLSTSILYCAISFSSSLILPAGLNVDGVRIKYGGTARGGVNYHMNDYVNAIDGSVPKRPMRTGGLRNPKIKVNSDSFVAARPSRYDPVPATSAQFDDCRSSFKTPHPFIMSFASFDDYAEARGVRVGVDVDCYDEVPAVTHEYSSEEEEGEGEGEDKWKQIGMGSYRSVHRKGNGTVIYKDIHGGYSESVRNSQLNSQPPNGALTPFDKEVRVSLFIYFIIIFYFFFFN